MFKSGVQVGYVHLHRLSNEIAMQRGSLVPQTRGSG
jgi:hypothetical protein